MNVAYTRVWWGLVLAVFDFRIQHVDVLPDILGYLLLLIGLSRLARDHGTFRVGQAAAGVLLALAIVPLIGGPQGYVQLIPVPERPALPALIMISVEGAITLAMF